MSGMLNKMMNLIGMGDEDDFGEEFLDTPHEPARERTQSSFRMSERNSKVVNINATARLDVVVLSPESFEDAREIADHLKSKKPCVLNLESVEREVARRIIDFLSGTVYALEGSIQKISAGIFLVAPYNVSILGDFKDELVKNKGVIPFNY